MWLRPTTYVFRLRPTTYFGLRPTTSLYCGQER